MKEEKNRRIFIGLTIIELVVIIVLAVMLILSRENQNSFGDKGTNTKTELSDTEEITVNTKIDNKTIEKYKEIDEQIIDKAHELSMMDDMLESTLKEEIFAKDEEEKKMEEEMKQERDNDRLIDTEVIVTKIIDVLDQTFYFMKKARL